MADFAFAGRNLEMRREPPRENWGNSMTTISQAWLTVTGLSLDFFGFCLLLREWWIAFLSEKSLMAHEEQLQRQQKMRAFASQNTSDTMRQHMTRTGEMQDDMVIRQARDERRTAQTGRKRWFLAATALIVLGFGFQFLGALPL